MQVQNKIVLSFAVALTMTSAASAQRRTAPTRPGEAGVAITLQVAGQPYRFEGKAACQHAPLGPLLPRPRRQRRDSVSRRPGHLRP